MGSFPRHGAAACKNPTRPRFARPPSPKTGRDIRTRPPPRSAHPPSRRRRRQGRGHGRRAVGRGVRPLAVTGEHPAQNHRARGISPSPSPSSGRAGVGSFPRHGAAACKNPTRPRFARPPSPKTGRDIRTRPPPGSARPPSRRRRRQGRGHGRRAVGRGVRPLAVTGEQPAQNHRARGIKLLPPRLRGGPGWGLFRGAALARASTPPGRASRVHPPRRRGGMARSTASKRSPAISTPPPPRPRPWLPRCRPRCSTARRDRRPAGQNHRDRGIKLLPPRLRGGPGWGLFRGTALAPASTPPGRASRVHPPRRRGGISSISTASIERSPAISRSPPCQSSALPRLRPAKAPPRWITRLETSIRSPIPCAAMPSRPHGLASLQFGNLP